MNNLLDEMEGRAKVRREGNKNIVVVDCECCVRMIYSIDIGLTFMNSRNIRQ